MNYIIDTKAYRNMFGANPDKAVMTEQFCNSLVKHGITKGITNERYAELEKQGRLAEITNDGRYFIIRFK
jgi:hypothetical protein